MHDSELVYTLKIQIINRQLNLKHAQYTLKITK